ncbi:glycosyltransferase [Pseudomonas sp. F-14 TE3623]
MPPTFLPSSGGRLPNVRIAERFAQAHVFVLPSVCPENQPVTITEAMACGLPVVASRIGGISELVDNGNTGFLFEHGNAEELAERLRNYIDRPELIVTHGTAGRERIQAYAFDLVIERIEALLASPGAERTETPQLIACHGAPPPGTFDTVLEELCPVPASRPQPASQPCCIPANWIKPEQADVLWVAGPVEGDPDAAMKYIEAYRKLGRWCWMNATCWWPVIRRHPCWFGGRASRLGSEAPVGVLQRFAGNG